MAERVYVPKQKRGRYVSYSGSVWDVDPVANTRDYCLWVERATSFAGADTSPAGAGRKAVLAFRGTSLQGLSELMKLRLTSYGFAKTADDLLADALIVAGRLKTGTRYAASLAAARSAVARFGADRTTIVGHSLGGRLAIETARDTGAWCIAFAPGYSPLEAPALLGPGSRSGRITVLGSHNDIVSYAARLSVSEGAGVGLQHVVEGAEGHGVSQYVDLFASPSYPGSALKIGRFE